MNTNKIKQKLVNIFKNDIIEVIDMNGMNDHFSIFVISDKFLNMSLIDRHKLIYKLFEKELTNEIHALQIKTYTKGEWHKDKKFND